MRDDSSSSSSDTEVIASAAARSNVDSSVGVFPPRRRAQTVEDMELGHRRAFPQNNNRNNSFDSDDDDDSDDEGFNNDHQEYRYWDEDDDSEDEEDDSFNDLPDIALMERPVGEQSRFEQYLISFLSHWFLRRAYHHHLVVGEEDGFSQADEEQDFLSTMRRLQWQQQQRRPPNHHCRFLRGFLVLAVYSFLVLRPLDPPELEDRLFLRFSSGSSSTTVIHHALPNTKKNHTFAQLPMLRHPRPSKPFAIQMEEDPARIPQQQQPDHGHRHIKQTKQKRILSHAHSNRLHQEPLVFGKEQKISFVSASSDDISAMAINTWFTHLVWFALLSLVVDTSYREWQRYRVIRRRMHHHNSSTFTRSTPPATAATTTATVAGRSSSFSSSLTRRQSNPQLQRRRYRTIPSPEPPLPRLRSQTNIF